MKYNHSDFGGFTEEQFAANDHFRQWVLFAEPEKEEFWNNYLQENPHRQPTRKFLRIEWHGVRLARVL